MNINYTFTFLGIIGGIFVWFFGQSPLNPWGFAHKFLNQEKYINTLLINEIDDDLVLPQTQPSNHSSMRSTFSQDDWKRHIEHEISAMKFVISNYLLDTSSWKKSNRINNSNQR